MRHRCSNPAYGGFKDYGARGIRVCKQWQVFDNFLSDMGQRPSESHQLKRLDTKKHFSPDNCRWMTPEDIAQRRSLSLIGRRFGRLEVLEAATNGGSRILRCRCQCDCGKQTTAPLRRLIQGVTLSCGCLRGEKRATHGETRDRKRTVEYITWFSMRYRCCNPSHSRYPGYGGRGIRVCARWQGKDGYANFLADMGRRPSARHRLRRLDREGDFSPDNCAWEVRPRTSS
jgi:hypothetical protein